MGQKVNPISNRLGIIRGWDSNWYGGNHELASSGVMLSTLLSMFTLPALMQLLFG